MADLVTFGETMLRYSSPPGERLELADRLDVSRSTLQYRLQRAEAWIVRSFVTRSMGPVTAEDSVAEGTRLRVGHSGV